MNPGIYRVDANNGTPIAGLEVEYVGPHMEADSIDPLARLLFGLPEGDSHEFRVVGDIPEDVQAEFDAALDSGMIDDPQADIRRVFLFDSEVELVEAAA